MKEYGYIPYQIDNLYWFELVNCINFIKERNKNIYKEKLIDYMMMFKIKHCEPKRTLKDLNDALFLICDNKSDSSYCDIDKLKSLKRKIKQKGGK